MADDTPETSFELTSQTEGPFFSLTVRTLTPFSTDSTLVPSPSSSFLSFLLFFFSSLFHFLFDAGCRFRRRSLATSFPGKERVSTFVHLPFRVTPTLFKV